MFMHGPKYTIISKGAPVARESAKHVSWVSVKGVPFAKREAHAKREAANIAKLYECKRFFGRFRNEEWYYDDSFEVFFA